MMLAFSGCLNQELKEEETMLPSLQTQELGMIKDQTLSWFTQHLNKSSGLLDNTIESIPLSNHIFTVRVLGLRVG